MTDIEEGRWMVNPSLVSPPYETPSHIKGHEHDWMDSYKGGGISKDSPYIEILVFFCKKCLAIRKVKIDVSDQWLDSEFLDKFDREMS